MTKAITRFQDLTQSKGWVDAGQIEQIVQLIDYCFVGIESRDYLNKYFFSESVKERKLRLFYEQNKVVGYCLITFSQEKVDGHLVNCIGASAAFYTEYRQGNNTFDFSIKEALKFWLKHPWRKTYYADTMLSPAMYRAVAKKVAYVYPREDEAVPEDVGVLLSRLKSKLAHEYIEESLHPHVIYVARKTNYRAEEIREFKQSEKLEIRYFCKINPKFDQGYALLTVIPVNFKQLLGMLFKRS